MTAIALAAGALIGWVMEKAMLESFGYAGTIRSALLVVIEATTPLLASLALGRGTPLPTLAQVLGSRAEWPESWLGRGLGMAFVLILGVALCEALGLVFNPRYHDFAFAAMTVAIVALSALTIDRRGAGPRGMAETVAAAVIASSFLNDASVGTTNVVRTPMTARTTSSSTSEKAVRRDIFITDPGVPIARGRSGGRCG